MRIEKNKKGTHVGVIISFVLFITILVFLYSMIEPTIKSQKNKQYFLDYVEGELIKNVSGVLTSWTMANKTIGITCLRVNNSELGTVGLNSIVKDKDNTIMDSNTSLDGIYLFIKWTPGVTFSKIYYSDELFKQAVSFSPTGCDSTGTITSSGRTVKYISRTKIANVINNFQDFQDGLNIPPGYYFSLSFTYSNGTIISAGEKNVSTSVYAKEKIVQYLDDEANINKGVINIRVW